ncbi:hypothetical protein GEMRC1_009275 [Eukaryota sp. GEM-RC1]
MKLVGIGNPLLDITAVVPADYLSKYELERGSAILAEEKHMEIFKELPSSFEVKFSGGGATQNTIRIAAALLGDGDCAYIGAVGDDDTAITLKDCVEKMVLIPFISMPKKKKTGCCACLINDQERTLVTTLEAANSLSIDHINSHKDEIMRSKVIYSAGYVLTACPEIVSLAETVSQSDDCVYAVNLSAPFLCEVPIFKESLMKMISFCALVFGNDSEAKAFAKSEDWGSDLEEIIVKLARLPYKGKNPETHRIVVITCGSDSTLVCVDGQTVQRFAVDPVDSESIVDVNGAGDSFVGGFLAMYASGEPISKCVDIGHKVAALIIQRSGVSTTGIKEVLTKPQEKLSPPPKRPRAISEST